MNWITDERGSFLEALHLPNDGQISILKINPGQIRGNHYHHKKVESFILLEGDAILYDKIMFPEKTETTTTQMIIGEEYCVLPDEAHSLYSENGATILIWCDEIFNKEDPDTYPEEVYLWN